MVHQSSGGRAQRAKGDNIKQALKVMLVLAVGVGAWSLYQIKISFGNDSEIDINETKRYRGYDYEAILLGRKGTSSQLDEIVFPDSGNVDSEQLEEDKAEEEFGHINEKFSTREGNEVDLEPESQPEVSSGKKDKDSSKTKSEKVGIKSRSEPGHKEQGHEKYPKRPMTNDSVSNDKEKEAQYREQLNDVQLRMNTTSDFSEKENDGDEEHRTREKETRMQKNVVEDAINASVTEEIDDVQSFHDENGVPPDVNETAIVFGQAHILLEEKISNVGKGRWLRKNIYEVTSAEDSTVEVNLEASKNDAVEADTSGIKHNSEIGEGDR
ncbi:hypothetical protein Fmac_003846 [Flemingia macrophylla]|uniref:Uncharacterized protein n=1 Tax=Flemingia macrophylla TaxID=520843 RepID=A0ABD1N3B2_9FABA